MAKKARPTNGEQLQIEGMEDKLSAKLKKLLRADRDACAEKRDSDKVAKAARLALTDRMREEGRESVRCPYRGDDILVDVKYGIKIKKVAGATPEEE